MTKGHNLDNPCVVYIGTGVHETGTWVVARISAPPEGPDITHLASTAIDIRPVPRRLKGPGRVVGNLSLTSWTEWGIQLTKLKNRMILIVIHTFYLKECVRWAM